MFACAESHQDYDLVEVLMIFGGVVALFLVVAVICWIGDQIM